jgi:hypothetical protein
MLQIIEQTLVDERCAIRMRAPQDGGFTVAAVANNGIPLAAGFGETLEAAVRDMLEDLGVLAAKEEACTIMT